MAKRKHLVHLAGAALGVVWGAPLLAAPPEENDKAAAEVGLAEIVVTAQKREERLQDVPIAISAIGSDYLKARDISSIEALGTIAPNVKIERAPTNKTVSQIAMRGSVTVNPSVLFEPAVGLYLDGVYIAKAQGSLFDVADIERIEVLRGPQGTLYGRNAVAGALNIVSKKPSGELGGKIEASYGNYDYWRVRGTLDLPKFGIFSAKLSGQISKRDGFYKVLGNASTDEGQSLDSKSGMVQVRAEPSDALTLDYVFDISVNDQQASPAQAITALQKLCHDLQVVSTGAAPRYFDAADLPRPPGLAALARWSKELVQAARTADHPFAVPLMLEALVAQARNVLHSAAATAKNTP